MAPESRRREAGQYYLMEKISQGGMAEIFKGLSYDVHGLKKTVCIKRILPHLAANKEFIDSLVDEAKLAVRLVHGNIAQTYDLGKVGDDYFMVMEFVDGKTLSQIHKACQAKGELIPIPLLAFFISEAASGLDYMHRRTDDHGEPLGIVHRDTSPQNIMVSTSGTVKIIDFGIAKAAAQVTSTDAGILKGKFAYMSPEQAHGDAIDRRSDLFSLGVILHEMLTGQRLFKAEDSRQTIRNVRRAKVEPPSSLRSEIPRELDRIVMRALAKDRRHRYAYASDLRDNLVKFLHAASPDFQPSDASSFLQGLFAGEPTPPGTAEADARTPHLIIDRSNSALADDSQFEPTGAAAMPPEAGEYMLEEEPPPPGEEFGEGRGGREGAPEDLRAEDAEEDEKTTPRWKSWLAPALKRGLIIGLAAGAAAFGAISLIRYVSQRPPAPPPERAAAATAQLLIVTEPSDADVALDGRAAGHGSPVALRDISAGADHLLRVTKEGFLPEERTIHLSPGEFKSLNVTLSPAPSTATALEIRSTPPGATIYLDDRESSLRTPATIPNLSIGAAHRIGLFLEGHRFWSKEVTLRGGETKSFDVNLARDFGSLLVDSSPPKALVMIDGAPVGQTPLTREELEPGRVYKVEVWLEGYGHEFREIKAVAGRKEELRLILNALPKAPEPPPAPSKAPEAAAKATPAPEKPAAPRKEAAEKPGGKGTEAPAAKSPPESRSDTLLEEPAPLR